jgi:sugar-specific transcriptional regulator TrmB
MKASQVASEADISQSKIYQPLKDLEEKGYVRLVDSNPKIYSAQNPRFVIKQERQAFEETSQQILEQLQEAWEIQEELGNDDEAAWVTRGREGKHSELSRLINEAEESIKGFDVALARAPRKLLEDLEEASRRDIEISIVSGSQSANQLERLQRAGAQVGVLTDISRSSFYVIDSEITLLSLSSDNSTVVIEDQDATRIITFEFENVLDESSEVTTE